MRERYDIVIAGGGMVGVSLALELGRRLPQSLSILLVEGVPLPGPGEGAAAYHPSFDARSTALGYSSRLIYEGMGVWSDLAEWTRAIESIHVSSRGHFGSTLLRAADHDWPALGYVVENAWLGTALVKALHRQGRAELLSPARVAAAEPRDDGVELAFADGGGVSTDLLLVADGAGSGLRRQLGVGASEKTYGQHALVANVATAEDHEGCAFERFTDEGPLALLPLLPVAGAGHRSSLVWTLPPVRAAELAASDEETFLGALQERFGYRLGRFLQVGERHSYPLSLVQSEEQVRRGVVVMGNAAHALHPVAGQGFNLALRDVAGLASALGAAVAAGERPGDLAVLEAYRRGQLGDQARTIDFSDRVPALFMHPDPLLSLGRDLALAGLDIVPALKREFVRHAAGVAAFGAQPRA